MVRRTFKIPGWARPETAAYMRQITTQLKALGLLEGADEGGLTMICMSYDAMLAAHAEMRETGMFDVNKQGVAVPSAAFSIVMQTQTQLTKLLREYGLTSKARASLKRLEDIGGEDDGGLLLSRLSREVAD